MTLPYRLISLAGLLLALAVSAAAQSSFEPVARVNESVITSYELNQRIRFLTLLQAPQEVREAALDQLVDERLQLQAAARAEVTVSEEEMAAGLEEFAGRANLDTEQFLQALAQGGVSEETFRDFVRAGLAWRGTVQSRFGPQLVIDQDDVARAMTRPAPGESVRVLLSEIVLPTNPAAPDEARALAAELSQITSTEEFAQAARRYSAARTAGRGGRVDWTPLGNLPPPVAEQVLTLRPGQVTEPIEVQNAVAVFQLRALDETAGGDGDALLDYARYLIPGGRSERALTEAARIEAHVDTCGDLYGVARGQPESRLQRDQARPSELPADVARELARLDAGEVSARLTRGDALVVLMLCRRGGPAADADDADLSAAREAALNQLRGARLSARADTYLAELRADAVIQRPE